MRGRRRNRAQRRPRIPPFASIAPVAQHRGGDAQLVGDLQQRPTTARQQGDCFSLELICVLTPSLDHHSTPFRSSRSLAKVSTNSGEPQLPILASASGRERVDKIGRVPLASANDFNRREDHHIAPPPEAVWPVLLELA